MRRLNLTNATFTYEPDDPEGFRSGMHRLGPQLGAAQTGASVYELPPGQALCPYHYEYGEEEWLLVLSGTPTVRVPDGSHQLGAGDLVFFPRGADGAHQVRNETDDPVRVLMWSTVITPTATVYPDSGKVAIWTGNREDDVIVTRSSAVDYWHGEAG
ncbi:MAG TPA: cupin domain-containing protein [Solirubrobacteraceae bacterium]|nr:cupin domain-containing protein [Solirubrobacteraceae bacterium]